MLDKPKRKLAIILRGPPAIGKSTTSRLLAEKMLPETAARIDLDKGWGQHEDKRYPHREGRYADLRDSSDVLIIELGWSH